MKTAAVIPAFNEATVLAEVIQGALDQVDTVILVDDCSSDDTAQVAREAGAEVVRHGIQRGAGRATATGIQAALRLGADLIVTLDADGQHRPEEIPQLLEPLREGQGDLVLGCRHLERHDMPLVRRLGNLTADLWTRFLFGVKVSDSQSGFRAMTRQAAQQLPLEARGYEFCSQSLGAAARLNLRLVEVPVTVIYTEYSMAKGQSFLNSIRTLIRIAGASLR